jgi:hypothetical protein
MALHLNGSYAKITTVGTTDTVAALSSTSRWLIEFDADGYLLRTAAAFDQALRVASVFSCASISTTKYSANTPNFKWQFVQETNVSSEVLLIDTDKDKSATNVVRYISPGETAVWNDLEVVAATACCSWSKQPISWSTLDPTVVSVNAQTGAVTGLTAGETATIVAKHIHLGTAYEKQYTVQVQKRDAPVYVIKHYYDVGFKSREGNGITKIGQYHEAVAARFESIFDVEMYYTIEPIVSICDDCKWDQFGVISDKFLDSPCTHSKYCTTTEQLREDLLAQTGMGDGITSIVLWTGHRMQDNENDRSNSRIDTKSVVITRLHTTEWNVLSNSYLEKTPEEKYIEETFTLLHELSHQLEAPDHYCYGKDDTTGVCNNKTCDVCCFDFDYPRACVMSYRYDLSTLSDNQMYCEECETIIRDHLADHH